MDPSKLIVELLKDNSFSPFTVVGILALVWSSAHVLMDEKVKSLFASVVRVVKCFEKEMLKEFRRTAIVLPGGLSNSLWLVQIICYVVLSACGWILAVVGAARGFLFVIHCDDQRAVMIMVIASVGVFATQVLAATYFRNKALDIELAFKVRRFIK